MTTAQFAEWLQANSWWLGYMFMPLLGGAIGHILQFEEAKVRWSFTEHVGGLVIAWVKAFFIAGIIYYLGLEFKLSQPLCFAVIGLFSAFGSDSIRWLYNVVKSRFPVPAAPKGDKDE